MRWAAGGGLLVVGGGGIHGEFFLSAKGVLMPDQITVSEFVAETNEDYKSPTASNFTTRMSHCRNTVAALEEVGDF